MRPCGSDEHVLSRRADNIRSHIYAPEVRRGSGLRRALDDLLLVAFIAFLALLFTGCCWMSKRSCYPPCEPPTHVVVEVEKTCELPPQVVLADVRSGPLMIQEADAYRPATSADEKKKAKWTLFPIADGGKLAKNLADLKTWIRRARVRCGPISQPTSQPAPP